MADDGAGGSRLVENDGRKRERDLEGGAPARAGVDLALQAAPDHPWVKKHQEWFTTRADGLGSNDIYVSYRTGAPGDDAWSTPMNLGPFVNTIDAEQASVYTREGGEGAASLYFNRGAMGSPNRDIYRALVSKGSGLSSGYKSRRSTPPTSIRLWFNRARVVPKFQPPPHRRWLRP